MQYALHYDENEVVHAICTALTGSRSPAGTGHSTGLQGDSIPMKDRHTPDNQSCRSALIKPNEPLLLQQNK